MRDAHAPSSTISGLAIVFCWRLQYFTMEVGSSRVVLTKWGGLGDTWPFFRPNWTSMEAMRQERGVDKVAGLRLGMICGSDC